MTSGRGSSVVTGPVGLTVAFVAVHAVLSAINLFDTDLNAMGDVTGVYRYWIDFWQTNGVLVGVNADWVYPIGALPPMMLAAVLGDAAYPVVWLLLVAVLDAAALVLLARTSRAVAWWWLLTTACLGPIALGRIDSIALPFALAGVLHVVRRPGVAAVLFTVAAWIKVWPAALVLGMVMAARRRAIVITAAATTSAVIVVAALAAGARSQIFSFIGEQTGRGLQIEAPVTALWLWDAALGIGGTSVYYDRALLTWQVQGAGVAQAAAVMTAVLAAGVLVVLLLGLLAVRRRADPPTVIALTALALVTAAVALNKVGSPQYFTWFVAPVVLGMLAAPRRFRTPMVLVPLLDVLTQLIYPWNYSKVTSLDPLWLVVLDLRDLGEFVLLGWCLLALLTLPPAPATIAAHRTIGRSAGSGPRVQTAR
ncbi:glycosyltransferase 87 family protein [uncultured Amnibacterium sp.]|uniref:glycosyltransferase 87 family protein n=1 Tax=uncultured Amnibacterium sp. TaxID=1631851 RepID=UPI0035CBF543